MRKEAKQELSDLCQNSYVVSSFLIRMKEEGKDLEEGRDGPLSFVVKDKRKYWKEHMKKFMNEES